MSKSDHAPQVLPPQTVEAQRFKTTQWIGYPTVTRDRLLNVPAADIPLGRYGGRADRRLNATGFFHARQVDGVWTLVDPDGHPFLCMAVNCVASHEESPDCRYAYPAKFQDRPDWTASTYRLLKEDLGFNTLGNWSAAADFQTNGSPLPYCLRLNLVGDFARQIGVQRKSYGGTDTKNQVLPIFHQSFAEHVDRCFQRVSAHRDDPWVLGLFTDNEIPLYERRILSRYLSMGDDDPGCRRARAWLKQRGRREGDITPDDDRAFCKFVLETYFSMIRRAMDQYLPNHMYLGVRFHKAVTSQLSAYEALGPYADVISINLYHRWTPDQRALTEWSRAAGKPLMMTEWYAKGNDSGLRNEAGAGLTVRTQADRGKFYQNFTLALLRNPNVVGWHWFRYMDEAPLSHGEEAANKGLVNHHYQPYAELTNAMRRINREAYALRDALVSFAHPNLPDSARVVQDPQFDEVETERTE